METASLGFWHRVGARDEPTKQRRHLLVTAKKKGGLVMKNATLGQGIKILSLVEQKEVPREQL